MDSVVLAPSERAVVDVLFDQPGDLVLEHRTPDRTYELVLWVCFADLGLIPVTIPLIIIGRTTLTDALRSIGVGQGTAPFAQHRTALSRFLVGSPVMRTGYAVTKVISFCGLALAQAFMEFSAHSSAARSVPTMMAVLRVTVWVAVAFCVFRGLPVIISALRRYWGVPAAPRAEVAG